MLIADDEELIRGALVALLSLEPDIEVIADVSDGRAAVHATLEHRPDVVLFDLEMPVMDGIQAAGMLPPTGPHVIIVTRHARPGTLKPAARCGRPHGGTESPDRAGSRCAPTHEGGAGHQAHRAVAWDRPRHGPQSPLVGHREAPCDLADRRRGAGRGARLDLTGHSCVMHGDAPGIGYARPLDSIPWTSTSRVPNPTRSPKRSASSATTEPRSSAMPG